MRKTMSVGIGKEAYIIALMDAIGFKEVERRVTGGYMSEEKIQFTFEGEAEKYRETDYVKVPTRSEGYFIYYSLRCPDGYSMNSDEAFRDMNDRANTNDFELCSFA